MNKETIQELAKQLGIGTRQIENYLADFIPEYCKLFMAKSIVPTMISVIAIIICFVALRMIYLYCKKHPRSIYFDTLLAIVATVYLVVAAFALIFLIIGIINIVEINASPTAYFYSNTILQ